MRLQPWTTCIAMHFGDRPKEFDYKCDWNYVSLHNHSAWKNKLSNLKRCQRQSTAPPQLRWFKYCVAKARWEFPQRCSGHIQLGGDPGKLTTCWSECISQLEDLAVSQELDAGKRMSVWPGLPSQFSIISDYLDTCTATVSFCVSEWT